jgi:cell division protein FtsI/penicillin-binding protein 2
MFNNNSEKSQDQNQEAIFKRRLNFLSFLVLFLFGLVIFRLYVLQIKSYAHYKKKADKQHFASSILNSRRGEIFLSEESGLVPVATNKDMFTAYAIPDNIGDDADFLSYKVSEILGLNKEEVLQSLSKNNDVYEPLKRKISEEEAEKIKKLDHKGIKLEGEVWRYYPNNSLAAQVVGFEGFKGDEKVGLYGIEKRQNSLLLGKSGWLKQEKDAGSRWISVGERLINPAQDGNDLVLSLDYAVQFKAELVLKNAVEKHRAEGGRVIVMNPNNGDIIAMAQEPSFDLNNFSEAEDPSFYMNSNVSNVYECGSVFKTFTMAAGLDAGVIEPDDTFVDTGSIAISGYTIKNSEEKVYGKQTMTGIIENSINTGVIFIEKKLGNSKFLEYVEKFGFGEKTGIDLPGELNGNISNLETNRDIEYYTASFGQGITVTPIQLATAYSVIANGGDLMKPRIVRSVLNSKEKKREIGEEFVERVVSQDSSNQVSLMLEKNVTNGHGKTAGVPGYRLAGKTGTAQISDKEKGGYVEDATTGSFAGFGPVDNPEFVIIVIIDDPKDVKWAESTAGPVFGEMAKFMLEHYGIKPTEEYNESDLEKFKTRHNYLNVMTKEDEISEKTDEEKEDEMSKD